MDYFMAMRLLVRSVEMGSFSKAAAHSGLKSSSVSRSIAALEQDLGTVLFRRSTRQLLLTDAGTAFYERAVKILAEFEEARRSAAVSAAEPVGTLKLWAPAEFGERHISPLLPRFMAATPGLSVDVTFGDSQQDVASPQYDLSIQIGEPTDSAFYAHRFAHNRYVICCSPSYLARAAEPKFPSALREHNCLLHSHLDLWQFGSAKSTVEVAVTVAGNYRSNRLLTILMATLTGIGFARLPVWLVGPYLASAELVVVLKGYEVTSKDTTIFGLYPEKRSTSPKIKALLDFLTENIGTPPTWEVGVNI